MGLLIQLLEDGILFSGDFNLYGRWLEFNGLVMIWSIYIALNQALAPSWDYISLGLWGTRERLWKLESSQHRFSTIILERKVSCWDDIEGNLLLRFKGLFHQWEFPLLAVTYIHSALTPAQRIPTPPSLPWHQGWSALAGKQPMSNKVAKYV